MGVLPLEFAPGEGAAELGLTGRELYAIEGLARGLSVGSELAVQAEAEGKTRSFKVKARLDTPAELEYFRYGGILRFVLAQLSSERARVAA